MNKWQEKSRKDKERRREHEHGVQYFMGRGYSREDADKFTRRHETVARVAGGFSWLGGGVAKVGGMAARDIGTHFREQYGMPHPQHGHTKKSEKTSGGSAVGGSGMFQSDVMDTHF